MSSRFIVHLQSESFCLVVYLTSVKASSFKYDKWVVMSGSMLGKRPRGRPKTKWGDRFDKDASELYAENCKAISQDKNWKRLVEAAWSVLPNRRVR